MYNTTYLTNAQTTKMETDRTDTVTLVNSVSEALNQVWHYAYGHYVKSLLIF